MTGQVSKASALFGPDRNGLPHIYLLPGGMHCAVEPTLVTTVLGSCVAACIRDRVSGIGGMNHFMLPDGGSDAGSPMSASMRYGAYAMEVLINQILKAGGRRENLEAKVFGGGNVLRGFTAMNVGERNAKFVRDFLRAENIRIVAEDLNDVHPRKVYFFGTFFISTSTAFSSCSSRPVGSRAGSLSTTWSASRCLFSVRSPEGSR